MVGILAIIPARAGSKGIPNKNIAKLNGHPLIAYSIKAALLTPSIDRVLVSTDSEMYAEIAREYGAETPFLRPKNISVDDSTDLEFVCHTLDWFNRTEGSLPRLIVHLRPTTPLRDLQVVEEAILRIEDLEQATALRSVHEMSNPAYKCFEVQDEYLACICTQSMDIESTTLARQGYPKTYEPNGYVDILKTEFVMSANKIHGNKVIAFETPRITDIDMMDDFDYLSYQINLNTALYQLYFDDTSG
jgi:N-acylneuraminate cytidylyltransferase